MTQPTFLFLDLENVQPEDFSGLAGDSLRIRVFLGAHQTKVPLKLAQAMQAFGPGAEYIQMRGNGHNALDFHIAYYLGRVAVEQPRARFLIVSNDTGFDPLVAHLKAEKIQCERLPSLEGLRKSLGAVAKPTTEKVEVIIADLVKRGAARPRTLRTLSGTIQSLFQKQLSESEVQTLVQELTARGVVKTSDGKLIYDLPKTL